MDTPTQALLGAVIGQAFFSGKLGRRAVGWGAVGAAVPDLDLIPIAFTGQFGEFLYHRGISHALWFGLVLGPLFGYGVMRWYALRCKRRSGHEGKQQGTVEHTGPLGAWMGLFVLALFTHPLLDIFTSYGTQLFTPFSHDRIAFHAVSIIDPFYSLILVVPLLYGAMAPKHRRLGMGRWAAGMALLLSTAYLFYGLGLNERAEKEVASQLTAEGIYNAQVHCYPTIFQPYLRRVVARMDTELCVGFITMWKPGPVKWGCFTIPKHPLIERLRQTEEGRLFEWFALGEVGPRLTKTEDGLVVELHDLRYGFGGPPDQGLWGIRAKFDRQGKMVGRVERFHPPYPVSWDTFLGLWRVTFGG